MVMMFFWVVTPCELVKADTNISEKHIVSTFLSPHGTTTQNNTVISLEVNPDFTCSNMNSTERNNIYKCNQVSHSSRKIIHTVVTESSYVNNTKKSPVLSYKLDKKSMASDSEESLTDMGSEVLMVVKVSMSM
jgi:hypothetical protein